MKLLVTKWNRLLSSNGWWWLQSDEVIAQVLQGSHSNALLRMGCYTHSTEVPRAPLIMSFYDSPANNEFDLNSNNENLL